MRIDIIILMRVCAVEDHYFDIEETSWDARSIMNNNYLDSLEIFASKSPYCIPSK